MKYTYAQVRGGRKDEVNPWYRAFEEPIGTPIMWVLVNFLPLLTPNILTLIGFLLTLAATWAFLSGYFVLGAILFESGRFFDWFDGKVAKITKQFSKRGGLYDDMADHARTFLMAGSLCFYLTIFTDNLIYILLGFIYVSIVSLTDIMAILIKRATGSQLMSALAEKTPQSFFVKIKEKCKQWRLRLGYTQCETDTILYFFAPLLTVFFGIQVFYYALILSIAMMTFIIFMYWIFFFRVVKEEPLKK